MKTPYRTPAEAEDYVSRTIGLTDEGRVQVAIPWIDHGGKLDLKSNRQMVERRLESLERSLRKHGPVVEKSTAGCCNTTLGEITLRFATCGTVHHWRAGSEVALET